MSPLPTTSFNKNILLNEEMKQKHKLLNRKAQSVRDKFLSKINLSFRLRKQRILITFGRNNL